MFHTKTNNYILERNIKSNVLNFDIRKSAYLISKRIIDIVISFISILLLSPVFIVCAIIIKLSDGGPIFYKSKRVGTYGKQFSFPKFRSMYVDSEKRKKGLLNVNQHGENCVTFKMKNDPRITTIGKWMRRFSIDELPQLFCVLIGTMSLVGPRPAIQSEVDQYTKYDRKRLNVIPGITCIWQVSGRGDIPFPMQVKMDIEYIKKRSFIFDLLLLVKTIPAVITGKGAY